MATLTQQVREMTQFMTQVMVMGFMGNMMTPVKFFPSSYANGPLMSINVKDFRPVSAQITQQGRYVVERVRPPAHYRGLVGVEGHGYGGNIEMEGITPEQYSILDAAYDAREIDFTALCKDNGWDDVPMRMKQDLFALMGSKLLTVSWRKVG